MEVQDDHSQVPHTMAGADGIVDSAGLYPGGARGRADGLGRARRLLCVPAGVWDRLQRAGPWLGQGTE